LERTTDGTTTAAGEGTVQEGSSDADSGSSIIQPNVTGEAGAAAWGYNLQGQLGNGSTTDSNVLVQVSNLSGVTAISGGGTTTGRGHSLAVKNDGTVWAWGENDKGQLGNGTSGTGTNSLAPVQVRDTSDPSGFLQNVTAISGGGFHSLAVKNNVISIREKKSKHKKRRTITFVIPVVVAWGNNGSGQLGNGTTGGGSCECSNVLVQVSNLSGVKAVSGGGFHSLAK
jgi:alpha-tubulin suppressor-like RCC1 family protein